MRINLALQNILHNPKKTLLSLAGVGTAILLIFMQLGFRGAVENTATSIYGKLDFDLLIRSPDYLHFVDPGKIEERYLQDIAGIDAVESVNFLKVTLANWRNPATGQTRALLLLGVNPQASPFRDRRVDRQFDRLTSLESLLMDRQSSSEFGPVNGRRFGKLDLEQTGEVAQSQVRIAGLFSMGAGLAANGAAIVSDQGFDRLDPTSSSRTVTLGLIKLEKRNEANEIASEIRGRFSSPQKTSIVVLTRQQVIQQELDRWLGETPIGFIFTLGVSISLVVGAAIVYMVLGNDVANRLPEYATLRAMGYSGFYLSSIVLRQALYLALFSFVPALGASVLLYGLTSWLANLTMEMTVARVVFVLGLALGMCACSGGLALKKLWQVAPAELF